MVAVAAAALFLIVHAPEVLAFPYTATIGHHRVYAEAPIRPALTQILAEADAKLTETPLDARAVGKRIFLTNGGWRWRLLSLRSPDAFAISRPIGEPIVVNRNEQDRDLVLNGRAVGSTRRLSSVLAHEMTHELIRSRYGLTADARYPSWLVEGYCDFVSGGGSLSDEEAASLRRAGANHPALVYYDGRRRVAALLTTPGATPDLLFGKP